MSPASGSSSSRAGSAAFGVAAWRASSWAWACSRRWCSSANWAVIRARIDAAAVSAGSAGSCSRLRIWAFCAVSSCRIRAPSAAAWASPVGGSGFVRGGQLGGEELGAAGAEDVLGEEQAGDLVQPLLGGFDGPRVVQVAGNIGGPGRGAGAFVVDPGVSPGPP
jgi:hypothetical protein